MMDELISRGAAIDAHKRAAYWQDAERKIAELPAMDAIPVEWLCDKMREESERGNILHAEYINDLIWKWHQEEQEAR